MRRFFTVAALFASAALSACTATYPVVGSFVDHDEVFIGEVHANLAKGTAFIDVQARNSGLRCIGNSRVLHIPASNKLAGAVGIPYCEGQKGLATLLCDDGRRIIAPWTSETCTTGYGSGADDEGAHFEFTFGMSEAEAQARFAEEAAEAAGKRSYAGGQAGTDAEGEDRVGFGTGFFVTAEGHLITNHHVIEGADDLGVLVGEDVLEARVLAVDPANDLALLRIDRKTTPVPLAHAVDLDRGDEVFVLGFPTPDLQGLNQKATFGRINALSGLADDVRYMQIDVPLQPGNSGGPLIDSAGRVVGVATATVSTLQAAIATGGAVPQNVNYALKIDYVLPMLRGLPITRQGSSGERPLRALTASYESSVVLVVVEGTGKNSPGF